MKDLLCAECGKQFSNKTCLRIHSRVHTHERPYKCRECNKTFSQNSALYYHKRIHSGLKPFECNVCHRTFHVKHNLKTHMVRHGGDRKFRCRLCPKAFALAQVSIYLSYLSKLSLAFLEIMFQSNIRLSISGDMAYSARRRQVPGGKAVYATS